MRVTDLTYAPSLKMQAHTHTVPSMSLVLSGALRECGANGEETARPLSISLMPAGARHHDEFGSDGARLLSVHFDSPDDSDWGGEKPPWSEWRWLHGGPLVPALLRVMTSLRESAPNHVIEQCVLDAIVTTTPAQFQRPVGSAPAWLARVRSAIDDGESWPSVTQLAEIGGVHRVHLAREFRKFYGRSVSGYIRSRRLQLATQRMMRSTDSLTTIAHRHGFSDQPHFCHSFRKETGLVPTAFRELGR